MLEAKIKVTGQLVSYHEINHKYKGKYQSKEIELVCPVCDQPVYLYGYKSIEVKGRLQHFPGTTCLFYENFCEGLRGFSAYDLENGQALRNLVERKEFASKLYCFCLNMCGPSNLSVKRFCSLIKIADKKRLWMAANLQEWVIGFLLLLLRDFEVPEIKEFDKRTDKHSYAFRFVLVRKARDEENLTIRPEDIWEKGDFLLKKVFESGVLMKFVKGNPFDVSPEIYEKFTSNWLEKQREHGEELIGAIRQLKFKGRKN